MDGPYSGAEMRYMWLTKPRAWVFQGSNHDASVGLFILGPVMEWARRRVIYVSGSKYSTGRTSDATSPVYEDGSNCNAMDSNEKYVPRSVQHAENTTWYPNSGATHHVCKDSTGLNATSSYSSMVMLLIGDVTGAKIVGVQNSTLASKNKFLHLSSILHVPTIRKNLIFVLICS